ncbi:MAG: hypothetical protein M3Y84_15130 [Acidobacteriota bacterium]|nr:hypothetical protein [Acidobacteriota bacterium]
MQHYDVVIIGDVAIHIRPLWIATLPPRFPTSKNEFLNPSKLYSDVVNAECHSEKDYSDLLRSIV